MSEKNSMAKLVGSVGRVVTTDYLQGCLAGRISCQLLWDPELPIGFPKLIFDDPPFNYYCFPRAQLMRYGWSNRRLRFDFPTHDVTVFAEDEVIKQVLPELLSGTVCRLSPLSIAEANPNLSFNTQTVMKITVSNLNSLFAYQEDRLKPLLPEKVLEMSVHRLLGMRLFLTQEPQAFSTISLLFAEMAVEVSGYYFWELWLALLSGVPLPEQSRVKIHRIRFGGYSADMP